MARQERLLSEVRIYCAAHHRRQVNPTLPAMPMRGQKIEEILCAVELAACYLGED